MRILDRTVTADADGLQHGLRPSEGLVLAHVLVDHDAFRDLVAHGIDVHLLAVQLLENLDGLLRGLLAEVGAEEVPHAVHLGLQGLPIGLNDGR